jgi:short-subunit dehydrogenase involved in D-alanine esterification of teichoic acids
VGLLDGKTAVITDGTSGIGLATATRFVDEGAWVFITGRRQAQLDEALGQLDERATSMRSRL